MTVLALEFRAVRDTADFGFLADEFPVRRVDPVGAHTAAPLTVRQQAADLAAEPVETVIAYCSCAALGAHIAELTGARLILIDPDVVTSAAIRRDVAVLAESLNAPVDADPETAFALARDDLAASQGGDDLAYEMVEELFAHYRAWLRFLAAAEASPPATVTGPITVITGKPLPDLGNLLSDPARVRSHLVTPDAGTLDSDKVRNLLRTLLRTRRISRPHGRRMRAWTGVGIWRS